MFSITPNYKQMTLLERVQYVNELPNRNPIKFLELLNEHIDLPTLIPTSFYITYNASDTNDRTYELSSMLAILLLIHFFKFAKVSDFLTILKEKSDASLKISLCLLWIFLMTMTKTCLKTLLTRAKAKWKFTILQD